jgi:hypothetical protein
VRCAVLVNAAEPRLYGVLLASVVASVAVLGTVPSSGAQGIVVNVLLGVSLLLAVRVAGVARPLLLIALVVAAAGLVAGVLHAADLIIGDGEARAMGALLVLFGPPAVGLGVVRSLRASAAVRVEAVMGVLTVYLLLGLLFAYVVGAIDRLGGAPFFADGVPATMQNCVYFSFTALTTTGFGDITARTPLGHTLTVYQALIGQIYLVTVVSLIVSNLKRREPAA